MVCAMQPLVFLEPPQCKGDLVEAWEPQVLCKPAFACVCLWLSGKPVMMLEALPQVLCCFERFLWGPLQNNGTAPEMPILATMTVWGRAERRLLEDLAGEAHMPRTIGRCPKASECLGSAIGAASFCVAIHFVELYTV